MDGSSNMIVGIKQSFFEVIDKNVECENTIQNLRLRIQEETEKSKEINQISDSPSPEIKKESQSINNVSNDVVQVMRIDIDDLQYQLSCIVAGCNNVKSASSDVSFFRLPVEQDWRLKWLTACKREDLMKSLDISLSVCSDHFTSEQLSSLSSETFQEYIIPSVFSSNHNFGSEDDNIETGNMSEDSNTRYIDSSHIKLEPDIDCYLDDYFDDVTVKHPGQLCRLCANNARDVIYIFSSTGKQLNIANKINSSLPISVQKYDPLPKQLCSSCVLKLDMCYQFSQNCILAEKKLKSSLNLKQFWSHPPGELMPSCSVDKKLNQDSVMDSSEAINEKTSNFILREESLSKDLNKPKTDNVIEDSNNLYCCPLCCEGKMIIQTDIVETDKNLPCNSKCSIELNDSTVMKHAAEKDLNDVHNNLVYEVRDEKGNNFTVIESNIGWWHDQNTLENSEIILETLNPQVSVLCEVGEIDSSVTSNWNIPNQMDVESADSTCQLCGKEFPSVEICLDHSKIHAEDDCYPCSICGIVCSTELDITSHCEEHKTDDKKARSKISRGRITCKKCGRRFNNERTLNDHICGSTESKQFRCEVCRKSYISEERLTFHRKFHEGARLNYCNQCGKEFDNEGSLYYHTKMVHEGARPFCCEECGKRFYSKARLERHKRVHSGERPFECEVCCRRFYDRETLKGHYITHASVKPFQCDLCGVCCGRKSMLKQHMLTHHSDSYTPKRCPSLIHYFCKICDKTFTSSSDVLTHRTTHWRAIQNGNSENKEPKSHVCELCGESFTMINLLGRHRKQEHSDEQPYLCSICKETSRTLYEARAHRKTHTSIDSKHKEKLKADEDNTSQNIFICEECGKPLPGRRRFLAHMKTHQMERPFVCKVCPRKFTEKQRLLVHMRLHSGEKPYSCKECGKRFSQSSALYTHALLHTGEKPHACDFCGKAFRIKADRDNHRRTHTGEKPYRCEFCSKQFRTGQVYYQHRMIHTGERRFPCDVCGRAFRRSHTLAVHKRIHTGEKPNICDICGRGFRQRTDMRKHRALHICNTNC